MMPPLRLLLWCLAVVLMVADADAQGGDWRAAEKYYDPQAMAEARHHLRTHHGDQRFLFLQAERLEYQSNEGNPLLLWDGQGWYGGDLHKLWVKSEGEYLADEGEFEEAEAQLLYSRAVSPYFDAQIGARHDFEPQPVKTYATVGLQGLAPLWFEVDAAAFLSEDSDLSARIEAEYELLLTQRLILQPRTELNLALQDVEEIGIGSGLNSVEAGLRLRYEIDRQFAPYLGVSWKSLAAKTADLARDEGEETESFSFIVGLRAWY